MFADSLRENYAFTSYWGAEGAPILFSDLGLHMASCSYIYIVW